MLQCCGVFFLFVDKGTRLVETESTDWTSFGTEFPCVASLVPCGCLFIFTTMTTQPVDAHRRSLHQLAGRSKSGGCWPEKRLGSRAQLIRWSVSDAWIPARTPSVRLPAAANTNSPFSLSAERLAAGGASRAKLRWPRFTSHVPNANSKSRLASLRPL